MSVSYTAVRGGRRPRRADGPRWTPAIVTSAVLHVAAVAILVAVRPPPAAPAAPIYSVNLVAAPPGARAIGVVDPEPPAASRPTPEPPTSAPTPPPRAETRAEAPAAPAPRDRPAPKPLPRATPVPPSAATPRKPPPSATRPAATKAADNAAAKPGASGSTAPRAGGGPEGGRGTDVANVDVRGLNFPFPGYLNNIVRQVALRFSPSNRNALLQADVSFLIHRDGSVSDVRVVRRSGNFGFDLDARGAVESAGTSKAFGPLPEGFRDDVLPVTFSFDPRIIR